MIQRTQLGDVTDFQLSWIPSRLAGYSVHMYAVRGVLIDCGFRGVAREVASVIKVARPRGAFLTHHHEDHAGNVELLGCAGVPVAADDATLAIVRQPQHIGLYRHIVWRSMLPLASKIVPFSDASLSLVPAPGHCDNHCCVWDDETGTLFSGDLYLGTKVQIAHRNENPRALVNSLRTMIVRQPARVFCAHRGLLRDGLTMLAAKADWLSEIIARADRCIDAGWNDAQIRKQLFGARGFADYFSAGDYASDNLVSAIRASRATVG
ncbi:MAG: MBL fold metallo-hydrolase [Gemmatimonadota bacterium]|nr:MBL fold metallo-hydrolase [Gemmatimonadota bacterium]